MTCEYHKGDGIVTDTVISGNGYPYDWLHCIHCGAVMSKPVSASKEPDRFRRLAGPEAITTAIRAGALKGVSQ